MMRETEQGKLKFKYQTIHIQANWLNLRDFYVKSMKIHVCESRVLLISKLVYISYLMKLCIELILLYKDDIQVKSNYIL